MYFEETNLYKTNDHFFYEVGQDLSSLTEKVPDLGGVFYILKLMLIQRYYENFGKLPIWDEG
jgi:hypothetical protein